IASYRHGELFLEDGNHRVEGVRRSGAHMTWAVIGFDDPEEREQFSVARANCPADGAAHRRLGQTSTQSRTASVKPSVRSTPARHAATPLARSCESISGCQRRVL